MPGIDRLMTIAVILYAQTYTHTQLQHRLFNLYHADDTECVNTGLPQS